MRAPRTLAVVSAATHHEWEGRLWSHAPYVREINLWAELFPRVVIVGPVVTTRPPGDGVPFAGDNVAVVGVPPTGGDRFSAKLRQLLLLPLLVGRICRALWRADAVHVRCPGNMGLLGVLVAPVFSRRLVAKYAGQWNGFPGEKWTVRLQRGVLRSRWWRGPVTVYGDWPDQPPNVVPFFTSVLTEDQIASAGLGTDRRRRENALRVLFVGRLTGPKNVATVLLALARVQAAGVEVRATIVGGGGERENLEHLARQQGIADVVKFTGAVDVDDVLAHYREADTLVLVSESEGWPKAIAEAMTFGLVCIGSDRGMVPQMLGDGRGIVVPPGDAEALTTALHEVARRPDEADEMGRRAAAWGRRHSLEGLQAAIAELLSQRWGTPIGTGRAPVPVLHVTDTLAAGGAERMAVNLVNHLSRDRYSPHLCTTRTEGVLAAEVFPDVGRLALHRTIRLRDPAALVRLVRYLRDESIEIVHAHGTSLFLAAAATPFAREARLVWHDHLGASMSSRQRQRRLYRWAARRADHVITVSHLLADWAGTELRFPAARVTTIANFVLPEDDPTVTEAPLELPGARGQRVVCVANLRHQKDHLMLLRAMARVVEVAPGAHALFLGAPVDPGVERSIRDGIAALGLEGDVSLLGARPDVARVLAQCDLGVLSSRSEGFPLALLEYGMAALPVVATDVGECDEILDHGAAGRVVAAGDDDAMAGAMIELLSSPATAAVLGERLRRRVEERYSAEAVVGEVEAIYEAVQAARR